MTEHGPVEIGFQVYAEEGGETFGAVRGLVPQTNAVVIYVENASDFEVPAETVRRVHDGKVILDVGRLVPHLRMAITDAHEREEPGV